MRPGGDDTVIDQFNNEAGRQIGLQLQSGALDDAESGVLDAFATGGLWCGVQVPCPGGT